MNTNKKMPLISIIIPCYNVEQWIDRCLSSIAEQTYPIENIELICVNDCSTDNTLYKLLEWEKRYPDNIVIVECEVNGRQGKARNIGLQYATAEWIAFIDSDDWVERDYLDTLMREAEDDCDIICCKYGRDFSKSLLYYSESTNDETEEVDCEGEAQPEIVEVFIQSEIDRKRVIVNPILKYCVWAKIIRKSFLVNNDLYFPINITYEDAVWGSLLHLYFIKAKIVNKKLYHYFVNEESTVLRQNSFHHFDSITSQTILWNMYDEKGFLDVYREELELEHIFSAYLPVVKAAIYRYDPPNYNMYLLIQAIMISRIGNYRNNKYVNEGFLSELQLLLLKSIDKRLGKSEFYSLAESVKKIGI